MKLSEIQKKDIKGFEKFNRFLEENFSSIEKMRAFFAKGGLTLQDPAGDQKPHTLKDIESNALFDKRAKDLIKDKIASEMRPHYLFLIKLGIFQSSEKFSIEPSAANKKDELNAFLKNTTNFMYALSIYENMRSKAAKAADEALKAKKKDPKDNSFVHAQYFATFELSSFFGVGAHDIPSEEILKKTGETFAKVTDHVTRLSPNPKTTPVAPVAAAPAANTQTGEDPAPAELGGTDSATVESAATTPGNRTPVAPTTDDVEQPTVPVTTSTADDKRAVVAETEAKPASQPVNTNPATESVATVGLVATFTEKLKNFVTGESSANPQAGKPQKGKPVVKPKPITTGAPKTQTAKPAAKAVPATAAVPSTAATQPTTAGATPAPAATKDGKQAAAPAKNAAATTAKKEDAKTAAATKAANQNARWFLSSAKKRQLKRLAVSFAVALVVGVAFGALSFATFGVAPALIGIAGASAFTMTLTLGLFAPKAKSMLGRILPQTIGGRILAGLMVGAVVGVTVAVGLGVLPFLAPLAASVFPFAFTSALTLETGLLTAGIALGSPLVIAGVIRTLEKGFSFIKYQVKHHNNEKPAAPADKKAKAPAPVKGAKPAPKADPKAVAPAKQESTKAKDAKDPASQVLVRDASFVRGLNTTVMARNDQVNVSELSHKADSKLGYRR